MLFSVVIPTHNRLHLLRSAVETVRRQYDADWELVVFDNGSQDPIDEHVRNLNDPRVRYERSDSFLSVTESWNRAIALARGDYVILLGDDDGLIPNYFARVEKIINQFQRPDVIYSDIYQFWHAGVAPWEPSAHLLEVRHGFFFAKRREPFKLGVKDARRAVAGSLALRINFSFNSQAFVYSRSFLAKLQARAPIFRSPFPDYYVANVALARSASTVIVPEPLAIAGVSKASYGFTMYNDLQARGDALLNTNYSNDSVYQAILPMLLPGPSYNTNFILAMEYVARDTNAELGKKANFKKYRKLQILSALRGYDSDAQQVSTWPDLWRQLSVSERIWAREVQLMLNARKRFPLIRRLIDTRLANMSSMIGFGPMPRHRGRNNYESVVELYDALEGGRID